MTEPSRLGDVIAAMSPRPPDAPRGRRMQRNRIGERAPISPRMRAAIFARDERCRWCWSTKDLELDHVIPWSNGGPDDATNLRLLCHSCNKKRSNYETDASTEKPKPIVKACLRCTREDTDSTERDVFCLKCKRFATARQDQVKLGQRYLHSSLVSEGIWDLSLAEVRAQIQRGELTA